MSWIAEAHRQWHTVNGQNEVCPLDCGVGEDAGWDEHEPEPLTAQEEAELQAWRRRQQDLDNNDHRDPWEDSPF